MVYYFTQHFPFFGPIVKKSIVDRIELCFTENERTAPPSTIGMYDNNSIIFLGCFCLELPRDGLIPHPKFSFFSMADKEWKRRKEC